MSQDFDPASTRPDELTFDATYKRNRPQIVWRKSVNDTDTPVSAYLKLAGTSTNAFLLESVEGGENLGRYSIIGINPDIVWRAKDDVVEINREADAGGGQFKTENYPMLDSLRALLAESRIDLPATIAQELPPMFAGVFGYFGYDTVNQLEKLPANADNGLNFYDAIFIRPTILAVFDNISREITFITPVRPKACVTADAAYQEATDRLNTAIEALTNSPKEAPKPMSKDEVIDIRSNLNDGEFNAMVETAKEYIRAGDIFQVVLSQRFSTPFAAEPFALYRALRRLNPSPFLFYLNFEDCALVGSSPEILVRVRNNEITIRPIAGTRPRGDTPEQDKALEAELLVDAKEIAEHLMLLDLGRNDVGRSASLGSVKVSEEFTIERYSHVMHIVSNVAGELAEGIDPVDALMAGFPAGTVSGAPKIRAMEIIAELEKDKRGPYAGCIGYFSADGSLDTCIALRTAAVKDGMMYIQAGAGIVADSDGYAENIECRNKANALVMAAKMAF